MSKSEIIIYTDGACLGNPGPGGYGIVIIDGDERKELSGGFRKTTNNRMEMLAASLALKELGDNRRRVKLYSDSRLLVDAVNKGWIKGWKSRGWKKSNGDKVLNRDLWEEFAEEFDKHDAKVEWVEAHVGIVENERCDTLAREAAMLPDLPVDPGYEEIPGKSIFDALETGEAVEEIEEEIINTKRTTIAGQRYVFRIIEERDELLLQVISPEGVKISLPADSAKKFTAAINKLINQLDDPKLF